MTIKPKKQPKINVSTLTPEVIEKMRLMNSPDLDLPESTVNVSSEVREAMRRGSKPIVSPDEIFRDFEGLKQRHSKLTHLATDISINGLKAVKEEKKPKEKKPVVERIKKGTLLDELGGNKITLRRSDTLEHIKYMLSRITCPHLNKKSLARMKDKNRILDAIASSGCTIISVLE